VDKKEAMETRQQYEPPNILLGIGYKKYNSFNVSLLVSDARNNPSKGGHH